MIPAALYPAAERDGLTNVTSTQFTARVRACHHLVLRVGRAGRPLLPDDGREKRASGRAARTDFPVERMDCPPGRADCPAERIGGFPERVGCPLKGLGCIPGRAGCSAERFDCPREDIGCNLERVGFPLENVRCGLEDADCPLERAVGRAECADVLRTGFGGRICGGGISAASCSCLYLTRSRKVLASRSVR